MADADTIDDYELVNCIATGNSTQVWEVKKPGATQSQAMKLLLPEAFKDAEQKRALKHEAQVGKSFEHPNLIRIQELKMTRKHGYFIMEYFRAPSLKASIRADLPNVQAKAKRLMECLTQALAYMHEKNWIHKDLKPDNVLMSRTGEVRLIDFTLTSRPGNVIAQALTSKKRISIQGTRTYLAPELIRRERLTPAADMYSLGVLLFETLTGNPPFRTANPNDLLMMHVRDAPAPPIDLDPNITPELNALVLKMLSKKPGDRPSNMNELFAEVRNLKFFKVDPLELRKTKLKAQEESDAQKQHEKLDSRMDAARTASGAPRTAAPPKPKPKPTLPLEKDPVSKAPAGKPAASQPAPATPAAMAPGMGFPGMPGMFPGYPGFPGVPGGMPFPGQFPFPGAMPGPGGMQMPGYPGFPQSGQFPAGQLPGGQFPQGQFPPGQFPPGPFPPGQPPVPGAPPGMLPGQPPVAPPSAVPGGAAAPTPASPPATPPARPKPVDDLPLASIDDLQIE